MLRLTREQADAVVRALAETTGIALAQPGWHGACRQGFAEHEFIARSTHPDYAGHDGFSLVLNDQLWLYASAAAPLPQDLVDGVAAARKRLGELAREWDVTSLRASLDLATVALVATPRERLGALAR